MEIGIYTSIYEGHTLEELLIQAKKLDVHIIELGVGCMFAKGPHCRPAELLSDKSKLKAFQMLLKKYDVTISAFSVHGNPVHPKKEIAEQENAEFEDACRLAEYLHVDRFNVMSGCPGGCETDMVPNWIVNPWPGDFQSASKYQWEDVLIPYWSKATRFAKEHGVDKIGMEMHTGMAVFNVEGLLRLRNAVGREICCNFDPSHLVWQGVNAFEAIVALGNAITHVHGKDVYINAPHVRVNGILSTTGFEDFLHRPWTFRPPGYGSDPQLWKDIMMALSAIGYDYVISIEYEDMYMSRNEGLKRAVETLRTVVNKEKGETLDAIMKS